MSLNDLSPEALKAAIRGGTDSWGRLGSADRHIRYAEPQTARGSHYLKCHCGCGAKAKWRGMANGVCLTEGCEWSMRRWAAVKKD
jgi:hypothetical protein